MKESKDNTARLLATKQILVKRYAPTSLTLTAPGRQVPERRFSKVDRSLWEEARPRHCTRCLRITLHGAWETRKPNTAFGVGSIHVQCGECGFHRWTRPIKLSKPS